ncbi:hypothetical protein BU14_0260s0007 [Porphyra umbilicalis]|uniref:Sugar phosphate transporter domain-containing protein n=1 Tax=Porphyra umbilicalis TaxID=2786 RepID=A0A1X6P228_PORUM|nr:hypothetical protein BU14_0260s0007 [Porphyra umbilicalis]|eukprot:OSX74939.1 hypothetical protein BU14_0260s0007 [Porphyra umbilicalis]
MGSQATPEEETRLRLDDGSSSSLPGAPGSVQKGGAVATAAGDGAGGTSKQRLTNAEVRRTVVESLAVCGFYISVSSAMVFSNKALSYTFHFTTTNVLLLLQMIFTALLLRFLRDVAHVIEFDDFVRAKAMRIAPVSLFYSLNAAVALLALRELSVPSYTLIKRLAPLFTIGLEYALLQRRATRSVLLSLFIMVGGTVLAARSDSTSATSSWMLGLTSCVFQALYLTYVKRSGVETGFSAYGVLYYHSILSVPMLVVLGGLMGEFPIAMAYPLWLKPSFLIVFSASLFMGFLLNYSLFLCTERTSPTSTVVSGQVKAMGQTAVGMFTFGGVDMNARYTAGTLLNIVGGIGYAYSKYRLILDSAGSR